jgi:virulence-associated protein VapD
VFAIAFDLEIADVLKIHRYPATAYQQIEKTLATYSFVRKQGSVFVTDRNDMANLFAAILALKKLADFSNYVEDLRAFKIEQWSDFTAFVKTP